MFCFVLFMKQNPVRLRLGALLVLKGDVGDPGERSVSGP